MKQNTIKGRIFFAAVAMTFIVAATNLAAKAATHEIHPSVVVFFRYVIAMITIKILLLLKGRKIVIDWADKRYFVLLTLSGILLNQIFFVWGLKYTIPSHPSLLYSTTSFLVILMLWIFNRQKPTRINIFSAIIALSGVAVIFGKNII
ncbi:MAG: DMT family transporter, partial [Candidatus Marinimicrobia bacterium]|nr:DMT family transporter [Candidatus Neomarinimicrobiota bacterium]